MTHRARRIVLYTFLTITTIFTIFSVYTSYTYFVVFKAVRDFHVTVGEFSLEFLNASVLTSMVVVVHNPSECTLAARGIVERLSLKGQFMSVDSLYMWQEPLQLYPMSSTNVTIGGEIIDKEKTDLIKMWHDEDWVAEIRIWLDVPLVGTFLRDEWMTTKVTRWLNQS